MIVDAHEKVWDLIPWFVNGRLSEDEAAVVSAHLTECVRCRDECDLQAKIHDTIRSEDSVAFAAESSFRKLTERIDSSAQRESGRGDRSRRVVMALAAALAVESVALVAWGAWTWVGQRSTEAPYVTLSSGGALPSSVAAAKGSLVRVVFAEEAALADVDQLLRRNDASMVEGPSEHGVYTIELRNAGESRAERLQALRASAFVRFAEPVVTEASGGP